MDADLAFMINIETHHQSHKMLLLYISFWRKDITFVAKRGQRKSRIHLHIVFFKVTFSNVFINIKKENGIHMHSGFGF